MLWVLNAILFVFAGLAAIGALAAYRSPKVCGPETVNAMRAVKAGGWTVAVIVILGIAFGMQRPPFDGVTLAIMTVLAFADAASYMERMSELVREELAQ